MCGSWGVVSTSIQVTCPMVSQFFILDPAFQCRSVAPPCRLCPTFHTAALSTSCRLSLVPPSFPLIHVASFPMSGTPPSPPYPGHSLAGFLSLTIKSLQSKSWHCCLLWSQPHVRPPQGYRQQGWGTLCSRSLYSQI